MTTKQVLETARARIADPSRWCQRSLADDDGRVCSLGAIAAARGWDGYDQDRWGTEPALRPLAEVLPHSEVFVQGGMNLQAARIAMYNDSHNHKCVLAAFDAAIDRAGKEQT